MKKKEEKEEREFGSHRSLRENKLAHTEGRPPVRWFSLSILRCSGEITSMIYEEGVWRSYMLSRELMTAQSVGREPLIWFEEADILTKALIPAHSVGSAPVN